MSPPSSNQASAMPPKPSHSRHTSSAAVQLQERLPSKAPSPKPSPIPPEHTVHYTCFIRLPFPRGNFQDPPLVEWDTVKDKALWKLISKTSNSKDLDWEEIATRFSVDLPFLLQQAAWLYERHFEGMRKQMQKLGVSQTPSPAPPETASSSGTAAAAQTGSGGLAMQRQGSKDPRLPSVINTLKAQPSVAVGSEGCSPGTPKLAQPAISRTPSTTTVTQSRLLAGSGKRPLQQRGQRTSSGSQRRPAAPSRTAADAVLDDEYALGHDGASESESEDEPCMARSQAFRRAPLGKKPALLTLSSDGDAEDDEDDSSGGYLPFAAASKGGKEDVTATLREPSAKRQSTGAQATTTSSRKSKEPPPPPEDSSVTSSASSAQPPPSSSAEDATASSSNPRPPGPISPRYRAQLANVNLSPRSRKDGSEGSPSMGSSFSDLEDASVTQSALEEALLSGMQQGNLSIGSRLGMGMGIGGLGKGARRQGQ